MNPVFFSPGCRDDNHHKCDGRAWNEITDELTECECHEGKP